MASGQISFEQTGWRIELRALVMLAIPVVLSELGWMVQGVVDMIMVGKLGPAAIGAVALGSAVYYTPSLFGIGLLLGLDTLVAQAYGRNDHEDCHRWLAQGVYLAIVATVPIMILVYLASFGFERFGVPAIVAAPAGAYLRVLNWGTLPLLLYAGVRRYLQAVGQVRVITLTFVAANLLNWLGNWLLISGRMGFPALGVEGSAISTCVSRAMMAVALIGFSWRYERRRGHPLFHDWAAPQIARLRALLRLGAPAAAQLLLEVGAWNLATLAAGSVRPSPMALATHQIALNYASLTYMVPLGVGASAAVMVGHAVGAGDLARARRAGWMALALGVGFMMLTGLVLFFFPRPLIEIYTRDPQVLAMGPALLGLAAAFQIFDGIQSVATGALRGLGETRLPVLANFVGYWLLGLPLGLTLCFVLGWGIYGLWIGLTLALIVISALLLRKWQTKSRVSI